MMGADDKGPVMGGGMMGDLDRGDATTPFDQRFLDAMIPHHQIAVEAAQYMIADSSRPEMRDLARRIVTGQQREIDQMTQWRTACYTGTVASTAATCGAGSTGTGTRTGRGGMMGTVYAST